MATNPSPVNVTFSGDPPTATPRPDPVPVTKGTNDGVRWTTTDPNYVFTGVIIDQITINPSSPDPSSGDFNGLVIDNTGANNRQSVMTVDDSLAEIEGSVHDRSHPYSVLFQARSGGTTYAFDPTIKNQN